MIFFPIYLCFITLFVKGINTKPFSCISEIYCQGKMLDEIQRSGIFLDSKTFVDMPTKRPESQVLAAFHDLPENASLSDLHKFLNENFDPPGSELDYPNPEDWKDNIELFNNIHDPDLLEFSKEIHCKWKNLIRVVNFSRLCEGCVSSHLNLKFPFVVPGGRFREFYYWDTFWILEGLLISEMWQTAKGVLLNFFEIVDQFGYIPNGSRIYYLNRSQPPLLVQMVKLYIEYTSDYSILLSALPFLDREYLFWMNYRVVELEHATSGSFKHRLNVYRVNNTLPRPESLMEDIHLGKNLPADEERIRFYGNLASAAESGWDFSSRWFKFDSLKDKHTHQEYSQMHGSARSYSVPFEDLTSIDIVSLIPLDLNAIMFANEKILATFHTIMTLHFGYAPSAMVDFYTKSAASRYEAMKMFLWSPTLSMWSDYNFVTKKLRNEAIYDFDVQKPHSKPLLSKFYISDFSPIWYFDNCDLEGFERVSITTSSNVNCLDDLKRLNDLVLINLLDHVECSLKQQNGDKNESRLWNYPGGIPISEIVSGQQWDFPNAWAPFQYYLVFALLKKSQSTQDGSLKNRLKHAALEIAQRWIKSTFCGWKRTGHFFEKYNVLYAGMPGEGGEYIVQDGFGWTNAVILMMLKKFGKDLKLPMDCSIRPPIYPYFKSTLKASLVRHSELVRSSSEKCLKDLHSIIQSTAHEKTILNLH